MFLRLLWLAHFQCYIKKMISQKRFRFLLLIYLVLHLLTIGAVYGVAPEFNLLQSEYQKAINEGGQFRINDVLLILISLFAVLILVLELVAIIALSLFWRWGPKLFIFSFICLDIIFPILIWWNGSSIQRYDFSIAEYNWALIGHLFRPLGSIRLVLTGIIITIIYSSLGEHLFKKKKI